MRVFRPERTNASGPRKKKIPGTRYALTVVEQERNETIAREFQLFHRGKHPIWPFFSFSFVRRPAAGKKEETSKAKPKTHSRLTSPHHTKTRNQRGRKRKDSFWCRSKGKPVDYQESPDEFFLTLFGRRPRHFNFILPSPPNEIL